MGRKSKYALSKEHCEKCIDLINKTGIVIYSVQEFIKYYGENRYDSFIPRNFRLIIGVKFYE